MTGKIRYAPAPSRYTGRHALITGGANGLGYASAARLAAEGATIGLVDLNADAVGAAAEKLRADGFDVNAYTADVTDDARIREVAAEFHASRGAIGMPGQSAYIASKSGIIGFTRVLAREGGPFGITANCILPGLIATEHVLSMREDVDDFFGMVIAGQCVPRRGEPDDVADAVAYLGSEGSEFVTGQSLSVGGGDRSL